MSHERICAKIDLSAACDNMESMHRNLFPDTRMIAVVKTNGYGHGAVPIAHRIESLPYLWGFAVATFEEAVELRQAGIQKPVLILGYAFPYFMRIWQSWVYVPPVSGRTCWNSWPPRELK